MYATSPSSRRRTSSALITGVPDEFRQVLVRQADVDRVAVPAAGPRSRSGRGGWATRRIGVVNCQSSRRSRNCARVVADSSSRWRARPARVRRPPAPGGPVRSPPRGRATACSCWGEANPRNALVPNGRSPKRPPRPRISRMNWTAVGDWVDQLDVPGRHHPAPPLWLRQINRFAGRQQPSPRRFHLAQALMNRSVHSVFRSIATLRSSYSRSILSDRPHGCVVAWTLPSALTPFARSPSRPRRASRAKSRARPGP